MNSPITTELERLGLVPYLKNKLEVIFMASALISLLVWGRDLHKGVELTFLLLGMLFEFILISDSYDLLRQKLKPNGWFFLVLGYCILANVYLMFFKTSVQSLLFHVLPIFVWFVSEVLVAFYTEKFKKM